MLHSECMPKPSFLTLVFFSPPNHFQRESTEGPISQGNSENWCRQEVLVRNLWTVSRLTFCSSLLGLAPFGCCDTTTARLHSGRTGISNLAKVRESQTHCSAYRGSTPLLLFSFALDPKHSGPMTNHITNPEMPAHHVAAPGLTEKPVFTQLPWKKPHCLPFANVCISKSKVAVEGWHL